MTAAVLAAAGVCKAVSLVAGEIAGRIARLVEYRR